MNAEKNTSVTLRISVYVGIAAVVIGLIIYMLDMGDLFLKIGLFTVIVSPFIGVIVTTVSLYLEKDMKWVCVALILIAISMVGVLIK